jgi:hypothetical protein
MEFNGIVDSTYIDRSNHSYQMISLKGNWRDYHIPRGEISKFFFDVEVGDSLSKKSDTDTVLVFRDLDTLVYILDYDCPDK